MVLGNEAEQRELRRILIRQALLIGSLCFAVWLERKLSGPDFGAGLRVRYEHWRDRERPHRERTPEVIHQAEQIVTEYLRSGRAKWAETME